jgi:hypothetical protein
LIDRYQHRDGEATIRNFRTIGTSHDGQDSNFITKQSETADQIKGMLSWNNTSTNTNTNTNINNNINNINVGLVLLLNVLSS